jgi:hypothetical protein
VWCWASRGTSGSRNFAFTSVSSSAAVVCAASSIVGMRSSLCAKKWDVIAAAARVDEGVVIAAGPSIASCVDDTSSYVIHSSGVTTMLLHHMP